MGQPCNCDVLETVKLTPHTKESLDNLSVPQLRQLANAHNLGKLGISGPKHSIWRATASKVDLVIALLAHKLGEQPEDAAAVSEVVKPKPATVKKALPKITDGGSIDDGVRMIAEHVSEEVFHKLLPDALLNQQPPLDLVEVRNIIDEEVNKIRGSFLHIQIEKHDGTIIDVGRQHSKFPELLAAIQARVHVMLVGPAGSGKTEAALAAGRGMGLEIEVISVGPQTTQSELAGYRDANGVYRNTALRRAFEFGKMLIIDEMDAGNGGVFTYLNACLSNDVAGFPDGPIKRHKDFFVIGCANTFGTGADMLYVGRAQLDAATLDRYVPMVWDYDEGFELDLALAHNPDARPWVETVWKYRRNMIASKIRHVISPRASIFGAKLLKQGFKQTQLEKMLIFKGLNKEVLDKLKKGVS